MCAECKSMIAARCHVSMDDVKGSYSNGFTIDGMPWEVWYEVFYEEDAGLPECR